MHAQEIWPQRHDSRSAAAFVAGGREPVAVVIKEKSVKYADIIAREVDSLIVEKQAYVLDLIEFIKLRQGSTSGASAVRTANEIVAFFRSFNVATSGYKFDREEANDR